MTESYDSLIRRAVPRYDEMLQRLMEYSPAAPSRILELGCGTGNLTLLLAARYPSAEITTVDASPEMTALTASRAGTAQVRTLTARFEDLDLAPASFDLVTSCMSLHHVKDKGSLYRSIHRWLAPGAALRFADQVRGDPEEIHALHWDAWLAFCRQPGNCTPDEIQSLKDHSSAHDHYVSLSDHFSLLINAGFPHPDCIWRTGMYAVLTA